jgi:hypothetical protein
MKQTANRQVIGGDGPRNSIHVQGNGLAETENKGNAHQDDDGQGEYNLPKKGSSRLEGGSLDI